jgi:heat shock protein HslJ
VYKFLSLLAVLVLLAACGAPEEERPRMSEVAIEQLLLDEVWRWTGAEGGAAAEAGSARAVTVDHPNRYTLEFLGDRRYSVRADCNSGSGTWSNAGQFTLSGGPMTLAACEPGSLDAQYLDLLSRVTKFSPAGPGRIRLTTADGMVMTFEAMPRATLAGTGWLVRAVNNGQGAVTSVLADSELTMTFGEDGTVAGSAGCNRFTGSFTVAEQTLSFSPLATTRMTCMAEGIVEQEQAFLAALASVATWEIRGHRAQLRASDGALAVDLQSAVTGIANIQTRQQLPAGAMLWVRLEDSARADAAATILGETAIALEGRGTSVSFTVPFDPAEVDGRMSYGLRATVRTQEDELLFTTTERHAVLTQDAGQFGIELVLDPVEGE